MHSTVVTPHVLIGTFGKGARPAPPIVFRPQTWLLAEGSKKADTVSYLEESGQRS